MSREVFGLVVAAAVLAGCGGAAPMLHPAHVLDAGDVTVGAGFSGTVAVAGDVDPQTGPERSVDEGAFASGFAPWVGARYGFGSDWEAGLTYSGRSIRLDGRHAFDLGEPDPTLSIGLGASGILPKREDDLGLRVGGFGGDLPILLGVRSDSDVYAAWIGARAGIELLRGQRTFDPDPADADTTTLQIDRLEGWHAHTGGLLGFRIGFRYIFAAMEVAAAMHWAKGTIGASEVSLRQVHVAPAGALVVKF